MFDATGETSDCSRLMTIRADGGDPRRLRVGCHTGRASWSPNGHKIVARRLSNRRPDGIVILRRDGSSRRFLTTGSNPDWQPIP